MNVVIQCASGKQPNAGTLMTSSGERVLFVANPTSAPKTSGISYAHPDDLSDRGQTWRSLLVEYNKQPESNPWGLLPAGELYAHRAYALLIRKFGPERVFILSAGWGLIPATFLTPCYEITFSASADEWKRRRHNDVFSDLNLLPNDGQTSIFVGGKDYLPLFCTLTAPFRGRKIVFFRSSSALQLPSHFELLRYETTTRTNWHYECARDLANSRLDVYEA